jgi:hypothetical protein
MSWLSKWWNNGGKKDVLRAVRSSVEDQAKRKALEKLQLLVSMLDRTDIEGVRRELSGMIKYVEGL